ncbi:MAG: hypothetical protein JWM95_3442 [Gemmatimonadetes bacterium]|nr:hypothetical protein [Gemmatimonadota bacterium]
MGCSLAGWRVRDDQRQCPLDDGTRRTQPRHHERHPVLNRRGLTLIELLVALTLAAVVLGSATTSLLRQQRTNALIRSSANADLQRTASLGVLASQLALLDPADVASGQALDTAIQVRAGIATSTSCAAGIGFATFGTDTASGVSARPDVGDTLWWRGDTSWTPAEIVGTNQVSSACLSGAPVMQVVVRQRDTIPVDVPLRVTRQTRYALYKSSDGTWQLGVREWSPSVHGFAAPQPFAGPFVQKSGIRRTGFRYFDESGVEMSGASVDVSRIARLRITAHSFLDTRERGQDSIRTDSVDVSFARPHAP